MQHRLSTLIVATLVASLAVPSSAHAQGGLFQRIKQTAKERAAIAAARAAASVVEKSGRVADTALAVAVTGVDSVGARATGGASGLVDRAAQELPGALGGRSRAAAARSADSSAATPAAPAALAAPTGPAAPAAPKPEATASRGAPSARAHR